MIRASKTRLSRAMLGPVLAAGLCIAAPAELSRADILASGTYCQHPIVRDYEAGLQKLPSVVEVPSSGRLPFAPSSLLLSLVSFPLNRSHLMAGGGSFGYSIQASNREALDWSVVSELVRLDSSGENGHVTDLASGDIDHISSRSDNRFILNVPSRPGSYRYDLLISKRDGNILGQYSRYVQVVRPRFVTRVGLAARVLNPGAVLVNRIENPGSDAIEYTGRYEIQRAVNSHWKFVGGRPSGRGFLPVVRFVGGGATSGCQRVRLSPALAPGQYRLVRFVRHDQRTSDSDVVVRRIASFQVKNKDRAHTRPVHGLG